MIQFNPREVNELTFDINISGNIKSVNEAAIHIGCNGFDIRVPAKFENGEVICQVPILEGILNEGEHSIKMELVIDGKQYFPLEDTIHVEAPLTVEAKIADSVSEKVIEESAPPVIKASLTKSLLSEAKKFTKGQVNG